MAFLGVVASAMLGSVQAGVGIVACVACATEYCPAVIAACSITCAFGTWLAPVCLAGCILGACGLPCGTACALSATCFHNTTMISTPWGEAPIGDVRVGDLVLGDGGYTPVAEMHYIPGEHKFVTAEFQEPEASLTVTEDHWMLVSGSPVQAVAVTKGMDMLRQVKTASSKVTGIARSSYPGKWAISTGSCTVYANGILTGTICGNASAPLWRGLAALMARESPLLA